MDRRGASGAGASRRTRNTVSSMRLMFAMNRTIPILIAFVGICLLVGYFRSDQSTPTHEDEPIDEQQLNSNDQRMITEGMDLLNSAVNCSGAVKVEQKTKQTVVGAVTLQLYYYEAAPAPNAQLQNGGRSVLLLHGIAADMDGTADVWLQVRTMEILAGAGYRVIAVDLPGTPKSRTARAPLSQSTSTYSLVVHSIIERLEMKRVTVVGASWGGQFSLSHMIDYNAELESSVHVCPVLPYFAADVLKRIKTWSMVIHGDGDKRLGFDSYNALKILPNLRHVVVPNAEHAVFQQQPAPFHAALLTFLDNPSGH